MVFLLCLLASILIANLSCHRAHSPRVGDLGKCNKRFVSALLYTHMLSSAVVAFRSLLDAGVRVAGFGASTMFRVAGATFLVTSPRSLPAVRASGSLYTGGSFVREYSTGRVDEDSGRVTSTTPPKKLFPYGESDFGIVRREYTFFADNSEYLSRLEQFGGKQNVFVRPPRFGKSLFLTMARHYYDIATTPEQFNELFGDLHIGQHTTSLARSQHVLDLDLSGVSLSDVQGSLNKAVNGAIIDTATKYDLLSAVKIDEQFCMFSLESFARAVGN